MTPHIRGKNRNKVLKERLLLWKIAKLSKHLEQKQKDLITEDSCPWCIKPVLRGKSNNSMQNGWLEKQKRTNKTLSTH